MTIRTKRRGKRSLAAVAAALLMASVLAVVAGAPAQAANTASEHMVDTNDDGKPDSRQFAGADRYATSLALAKQYATAQGGLGIIDTVILASGESQIDAVAAAGLAGYKQAPVLLTRSTGLDQGAARFIEEQGVSTVVIVGGTAVIPDGVATQVEDLESEPKVMRLAGADRYATASAISSEIGTTGSWCGTDDTTAILANGMDMSDAISAGPVAYALELPLLLSGMDVLPEASSAFISGEKVERVVILGGTGSVSEGVADAVKALGAAVTRVGGESAAETSAMLAERMTGDCSDDLQTDTTRVALVNSVATADGVSAGPVLGAGFGDGPVPVLLVTDELPASVRDYLAKTPEVDASGDKTNLSVVAVGGTAVVSEAVMAAAVEAAMSADALSVSIKATPTAADAVDDDDEALTDLTSGTFTLEFSDSVAAVSYSKLKDALYVNDSPASIMTDDSDVLFIAGTPGALCNKKASLTVSLTHALKQGDRIEVRPTAATVVGDNMDKRVLSSASFTVPAAAAASSAKPSTEIVAVVGQDKVYVYSDLPGSGAASKVKVRRGSATVTASGVVVTDMATTAPFGTRHEFTIPDIGTDDNDTDADETKLMKGDVVILEAGAIKANKTEMQAETMSRATSRTVTAAKRLKVSSILVSQVDPGVDDDLTTPAPEMRQTDEDSAYPISMLASAEVPGTTGNVVTVKAKWSGDAAGAAGNAWSVSVDAVTGIDTTAKTPEIDVSVNTRNQVIRVRYMAGSPTVADLVAALDDNDDFADRFSASSDSCESALLKTPVTTTPDEEGLSGGRSSVGVTVTFNDWVSVLDPTAPTLKANVFGGLIAGYATDTSAERASDAGLGTNGETYSVSAARFLMPYNRVHFLVTTSDPSKLPSTRSGKNVVTISTGDVAKDNTDGADPDKYVATGYFAQDPDTANVDETMNEGGRVSARRSNSVPVK